MSDIRPDEVAVTLITRRADDDGRIRQHLYLKRETWNRRYLLDQPALEVLFRSTPAAEMDLL